MESTSDLNEQSEAVDRLTRQTTALKQEMDATNTVLKGFAENLTQSLKSALIDGKSLQSLFKELALSLSGNLLKAASSNLFNKLEGFFNPIPDKKKSAAVTGFANGGVISSPLTFPMAEGTGLVGEAGAEAILPLARGADGRLGVQAGGNGASVITVNISTPDAQSFQKSEGQIRRLMAKAVAEGHRRL